MKKYSVLIVFLVLAFITVFFLHQYLMNVFNIENRDVVWQFYYFITGVSGLMISNLFLIQAVKKKYTGFVFLAWSMIKLMLVMAFFLYFVYKPKIFLSDNAIFDMVILYMTFLIIEVLLTIFLLKQKIPVD